ncbi:MAG: hypothetical protein C4534_10430, partial [Gaiellales bacterium]
LFIRDLRRERATEEMQTGIAAGREVLQELSASLKPPDAVLVGPGHLRSVTEQFAAQASGEMIWLNTCLSMFRPQELFDKLLRPAVENPRVTSIQFILDHSQHELWEEEVIPKVEACDGRNKVKPPRWVRIEEPISMIIANIGLREKTECLLSFWGEPFMATSSERSVPRYIFHVQSHSELMARLSEVERNYRFG